MSFSVLASFPLGTYKAHVGDGERDLLPSPARLHAAFIAAAGAGARAVASREGLLEPHPLDRTALEWLEANPPDGMVVPESRSGPRDYVRFRATGALPKEIGQWRLRKFTGDPPESSVSLDGPIGWIWDDEPPTAVRDVLTALAPDVSHLGTAESPVRIEVYDALTPTHVRDDAATLWGGDGLDMATPVTGRTDLLERAHKAFMTGNVGADSHRTGDAPVPPPRVVDEATRVVRFVSTAPPPAWTAPWDSIFLIPIVGGAAPARLGVDRRVAAAVACHKALVKAIGFGAPSLVTGHYLPGANRPSNRLAIHLITSDMPCRHTGGAPHLALAFPHDADPADVHIVIDAAQRLRDVGPKGRRFTLGPKAMMVSGRDFWEAGHQAAVETAVPALSDIRPSRARGWSLEDAAHLAVSLVWRDEVAARGRGVAWMRTLADAARNRGVSVLATKAIRDDHVARFAHHTHPDALIAPFRVKLTLGSLGSAADFVAIGQTRHLGGGLLVPTEVS